VRAALAIVETPEPKPRAQLVCPVLAPPIVGCAGGSALTATSLAAALGPLAAARTTPIIVNERVASLRLDVPVPSLGLRAGDLVLAIDGRHVTSAAQLGELLTRARSKAVITLQRGAEAATLEVTEQRF
jgi:S1-C subfamily serine protease